MVAAAVAPSSVLTKTGEGSDELMFFKDSGESMCTTDVPCVNHETRGSFPAISRAPFRALDIKPWDRGCHGSSIPLEAWGGPEDMVHTSAGLVSSSVKMSFRNLRIYEAMRGNFVCMVSLTHA